MQPSGQTINNQPTSHHQSSGGTSHHHPSSSLLQQIFQQSMSLVLQNELDRDYIFRLCKEIKLIRQSKIDWSVQDVIRFLSLIKVEECIRDIIVQWEIDGAKLFDIEYLSNNLECIITDRNYFPLYKLFHTVTAILQITEDREHAMQKRDEIECKILDESAVDIPEELITGLKEELGKLNNTSVIELGCGQLARMLREVRLMQESEGVKKWGVDGFSLVCILGNQGDSQTLRNYFSDQDIRMLTRLSQLFLHLYFSQFAQMQPQTSLTDLNIDDLSIEFKDLQFDQNRSFHSSQYGVSEEGDFKNDEEEIPGNPMRRSEYGVSERGSVGVSEYGVSVRGSVAISIAGSMRDSTRGSITEQVYRRSVAESVYASSEIMQDQSVHEVSNKKQQHVIAVSSIQDDSIVASLMAVSLRLPFNLLNLQPLQRIKISSIPYPFNLTKNTAFVKKESSNTNGQYVTATSENQSQKSESIYDLIDEEEELREFKVFNLTGAKFGRSPENDFSYPDELSISGRHAQIVFKDESYYLRDLGSKTGTFVYISQRKPLILSDEQLVQLSYEVEFKVLIIKNDVNEGIIKFEFKKPDNQPPYRAILKNNNTVRIGKAENSHIKLNHQSISSYHAQIKYQEGRFLMYDCNTRTGTWLRLSSKGVRSSDRRLSKLDIIRISSKKTFLIQDVTEGIEFASSCDSKWKYDQH